MEGDHVADAALPGETAGLPWSFSHVNVGAPIEKAVEAAIKEKGQRTEQPR